MKTFKIIYSNHFITSEGTVDNKRLLRRNIDWHWDDSNPWPFVWIGVVMAGWRPVPPIANGFRVTMVTSNYFWFLCHFLFCLPSVVHNISTNTGCFHANSSKSTHVQPFAKSFPPRPYRSLWVRCCLAVWTINSCQFSKVQFNNKPCTEVL